MAAPVPPVPEGVDQDDWDAAVQSIRVWCGWHIAPVFTETVTVDSPGGSEIGLPTLRLVDLVSITDNGSAVTDPEWSADGMVRGGWTRRYRGVVAEMKHGYDAFPAVVMQVARGLAGRVSRGPVMSVRSTAGPFSEQWAVGSDGMPAGPTLTGADRSALAPYKIPTAP